MGVGMINPVWNQHTHRGRNDDGSETAATWKVSQGLNFSQLVDTNFRVRFRIRQTQTLVAGFNINFEIRWSINGGSYSDVGGQASTTNAVRHAATIHFVDNSATTEQLTGPGTFQAGRSNEAAAVGSHAWPAAQRDSEYEFSIELYGPQVSDGDLIRLRVYETNNVALDTYTDTPVITVLKPGGGPEVMWFD